VCGLIGLLRVRCDVLGALGAEIVGHSAFNLLNSTDEYTYEHTDQRSAKFGGSPHKAVLK
jgi:hypothetical protein